MNGSIVKRGRNRYSIILEMRDPTTGQRKRKWHAFRGTRAGAETERRKLLTAFEGGVYIEPSKTTIAEFLDKWLDHIKPQVSPRSHERYTEIATKNLLPLIGGVILAKLQPMQISTAYAKALASGRRDGKGGLAPRSVHHMHRILKQALGQAVRWQLLTRNPCDAVDPPKVERQEIDTIDLRQTAELLRALRDTRMYVPTLLGVMCGLRRGEVAALRWRSVDLAAGNLAVVQSAEQTKAGVRYKEPKSGKARSLALSATVIEELKVWRVRQAQELLRLGVRPDGETFVVTQADGNPVQPHSITHEWVRLLRVRKLRRIRFHDLRHAHATHLLANGVHPKVASERLGHSKVGITLDLYSHVMPGMQEDAAAKVDAAFRAAQKAMVAKW